ncbi:MAG: hypothetical protein V4489_05575, partial [Chlamydiota bacterium]
EEPFTVNRLGVLMKERYFFTGNGYSYMNASVAVKYGEVLVGKSEWVLIDRGVLLNSRNKNVQEQEAMIKPPYREPEVLPMATGTILWYLNSPNNERSFGDKPWTYTCCKEKIGEHRVVLGGFTNYGLVVSHYDDCDYDEDDYGIGTMVKFDS